MNQQELREWFIEVKSKPCTDCGQLFPWYCMDFDHVPGRGEKRFNLGMETVRKRKRFEDVIEEIEKCDLVCAVCHRMRTHERGYPKDGSAYLKDECIRGHDLTDPQNWKMEKGKRKGCLPCANKRRRERYQSDDEYRERIKAQSREHGQKEESKAKRQLRETKKSFLLEEKGE